MLITPARPKPPTPPAPKTPPPSKDDFDPIELIRDGIEKDPLIRAGAMGSLAYVAGSAYPTVWMHEMGHALTAEALFQGANPIVEVTPFGGGVTYWRPGPLTERGQQLGFDGARAAVSAAGPLVDMAMAMTTFGVGYKIRKEHPYVGSALMGYAAFSVVNDILYASSALGNVAKAAATGNDFANIAVRTGLHPLASIAIMAAILPAEYLLLRYLENN